MKKIDQRKEFYVCNYCSREEAVLLTPRIAPSDKAWSVRKYYGCFHCFRIYKVSYIGGNRTSTRTTKFGAKNHSFYWRKPDRHIYYSSADKTLKPISEFKDQIAQCLREF